MNNSNEAICNFLNQMRDEIVSRIRDYYFLTDIIGEKVYDGMKNDIDNVAKIMTGVIIATDRKIEDGNN